jgi:hypothetical protein
LGRTKNINKNPNAERAVQEVNEHILRLDPCAQTISPLMSTVFCAALEMLTQCDQFTNNQLPVSDRDLVSQKHLLRSSNHFSSEKHPLGYTRTKQTYS